MNKKLIVSGVLAAVMMGGLSGVQAAGNLESRVGVLESAVHNLEGQVGTVNPAKVTELDGKVTTNIGEIANNKKGIEDNKNAIKAEEQWRRIQDKELHNKINRLGDGLKEYIAENTTNIEANKTGIEANKTGMEANKADIANLKEYAVGETGFRKQADQQLGKRIDGVQADLKKEKAFTTKRVLILNDKIKDINKTLEDSGARATAEATQDARKWAEAAKEVAEQTEARQTTQDLAIEDNKNAIKAEEQWRRIQDKELHNKINRLEDGLKENIAENTTNIETNAKNIETKVDIADFEEYKADETGFRKQADKKLGERIDGVQADLKKEKAFTTKRVLILNDKIKENKAGIEANSIAINNQVSNIKQAYELIGNNAKGIEANKTGIEANKTSIAALDKKLTGADVALGGRIDQLATDTDKGLAKASALAALHPLDFDPSSKLNFAVAGGFYNGENAVALGAFYRPNRNVMLSFGSSIAGGENAYNVGLSVKVGKGGDRINQSNTTISELYDLVGRLQDQVAEQQKKIEELQAK